MALMKVLVDEMYEGFVKNLKDAGYEVESVKQLINEGKSMGSDYSVLTYAKERDMILITADVENHKGCKENGIKYIPINKETVLKSMLDGLKNFGG